MRRPLIRATPAMLKRAAGLYRPLGMGRPPIAERKPDARQHQLDLADVQPVERENDSIPSKS